MPGSSLQLKKIVSGGQTGVDRGALDAAIAAGLEHGGWCPRNRRAEDGEIPAKYQLQEENSPRYHVRTERNVLESDGTLVLFRSKLSGGTALTVRFAERHRRPLLLVDLASEETLAQRATAIRRWLRSERIGALNVAGPRESQQPGIQLATCELIAQLLTPRAHRIRPCA